MFFCCKESSVLSDALYRTAIDINLHRVALFPDATTALPSWLLRSMIRTWLLTTVTDRTLSAQLGKPSSMRGENSVQRYLSLLYGYIEQSKKTNDHQAVLDDLAVALWAVSNIVGCSIHSLKCSPTGMDTDSQQSARYLSQSGNVGTVTDGHWRGLLPRVSRE